MSSAPYANVPPAAIRHPRVTPIVVIPSRMASTRLPGKPLALIAGRPMVLHVLDRARDAGIGPAAVACADESILVRVQAAGGAAVLTDPALPSGSDLVFCGHHGNAHRPSLLVAGASLHDETDKLLVSRESSAAA